VQNDILMKRVFHTHEFVEMRHGIYGDLIWQRDFKLHREKEISFSATGKKSCTPTAWVQMGV
jgi:hypothetical protein